MNGVEVLFDPHVRERLPRSSVRPTCRAKASARTHTPTRPPGPLAKPKQASKPSRAAAFFGDAAAWLFANRPFPSTASPPTSHSPPLSSPRGPLPSCRQFRVVPMADGLSTTQSIFFSFYSSLFGECASP